MKKSSKKHCSGAYSGNDAFLEDCRFIYYNLTEADIDEHNIKGKGIKLRPNAWTASWHGWDPKTRKEKIVAIFHRREEEAVLSSTKRAYETFIRDTPGARIDSSSPADSFCYKVMPSYVEFPDILALNWNSFIWEKRKRVTEKFYAQGGVLSLQEGQQVMDSIVISFESLVDGCTGRGTLAKLRNFLAKHLLGKNISDENFEAALQFIRTKAACPSPV